MHIVSKVSFLVSSRPDSVARPPNVVSIEERPKHFKVRGITPAFCAIVNRILGQLCFNQFHFHLRFALYNHRATAVRPIEIFLQPHEPLSALFRIINV